MKRIMGLLLSVMMCTGSVFATAAKSNVVSTGFVLSGYVTTSDIKGLSGKLIKIAGIKRIEPNVEAHSVKITYNPKQVTMSDVIETLRKNGYSATVATENQLKVSNYVIRFN